MGEIRSYDMGCKIKGGIMNLVSKRCDKWFRDFIDGMKSLVMIILLDRVEGMYVWWVVGILVYVDKCMF